MTEIVTKKFMKLGTVNLPVGTKLDGLSDGIISELATRGLADIVKGKAVEPKPEKPHKEKKPEMGF